MKTTKETTTRLCFAAAGLILLAAAMSLRADYSSTVTSFNPLAYWRFNETATSPALNKTVNASTKGSILDGYVVADATLGQPGVVGTCVRLINVGSAAAFANGKIDVPFNTALNKSGAFSIEFWMNPTSMADATGMAILSSMMNDFTASARIGYLVYVNNVGRFEFRLGNSLGYVGTVNSGSSSLNAVVGQWRHVVCTFDGSVNRIFVNGTQVASLTLTAGQIAGLQQNTEMPFRIGGTPFNGTLSTDDIPWASAAGVTGNRCFDGYVDEVAYYASALSPSTIAAHHAAATTNNAGYAAQIVADNPVGYWGLNEAAATPPNPATLPIAVNSGTLGSAINGTNMWGVLAAQNGAPYPGFGAGNKAILNDGVSGGYLGLPNDPGLNISGNITMMAWIKPTAKNFFRDIIAHGWVMPLPGGDGTLDYQETFLRIGRGGDNGGFGSGNFYEVGVTDGGANTYYDTATFPMPEGDLGNWVFIAGTYDGVNWNLYRNGALVGTLPSTHGALALGDRWSVGSRSDASAVSSMYFPGYIDEPAIFGTALSATDINNIYNAAQVQPVISRAVKAPTDAFKGSSLDLSVWAEGSPTLGYQWTSNGIPLGVTATNVVINNLQAGSQIFSVIVTNAYGSATSSVTVVVVAAPPSITQQPQSLSRFVGYPFTFSVTAGGTTPLSYQWKTNGTAIPGATASSYSGTVSAATAGSYTVTISNETAVLVTSTPATLTAVPIPTGYAGAVIGSGPIAFWRLNESSGTICKDYIGGANGTYISATLGEPGYAVTDPDTAASFSGADSYVGNISGTAINFQGTTASFTLECWANGAEGQPDEASLIAKGAGQDGTTASEQFSLDVAGGKYRFFTRGNNNALFEADATVGPNGTWQHIVAVYDASVPTAPQMSLYVNGELSGSGGGRPAGLRASSAPVSIASKRRGNAITYDGAFVGSVDEVSVYNTPLDAATVQAHYASAYGPSLAPVIDLQPKSVSNYVGLPVTLSVAAHGTVPLNYQWKKGGGDIAGATLSSYTITSLTPADDDNYSVGITNGINPGKLSASAHITVLSAPTSPPAIPGLVLRLPFDNNLTDATGRGNNGAGIRRIQNLGVISSNIVPPTYVPGQVGSGVHFVTTATDASGTNWDNSYVSLNDRADFHFSSNVNFTVAFWVKNTDAVAAEWGDLPFLTTTVGSTFGSGLVFAWSYGYGATPYIGSWAFSCYDLAGNGVGGRGEQGSIDDGNWHHLVHVFDRKLGNVNYVDGVPVAFHKQAGTSTTAAGNIDTGSWLTIGQDPAGSYAEAGSGAIDELGVWKKALTPLEAASLYMAGKNNLSFTDAPYKLTATQSGNNLTLSWSVGVLQQADVVSGPYTDVPGATSPRTVALTGAGKFYRIKL